MSRTKIATAAVIAAAALCLPLTACGPGGSPEALTLTIGTDDAPGVPSAAQIENFASEVDELSGGRIVIEPVWGAAGAGIPDWDQAIAQLAIDGELDLALVPSRSWDALGVTSLRPLNAPFLIDSDALVEEVLTSDLTDTMMAGLAEAGVEGLGMWPEGLRHPFSYAEALGGPADYAGALIRTATSATVDEVFAALGATTNDDAPSVTVHTAIESSYLLDPGGVATGDVTFYPKVNVLVAGDAVLSDLSTADREILDTAAARTQAWAFDTQPDDLDAAREFCEGGGSVALAGAEDVAALTAATSPVTDDIAADPGSADVLAVIADLKAELPAPTAPEECSGAVIPAGQIDSIIDGVYRCELTPQDYADAGIVLPEGEAENQSGTFTLTLWNGTYHMLQERAGKADESEVGTFTIDDDTMVLTIPSIPAVEKYGFAKDADGTVQLTPISPADEAAEVLLSGTPWQRVGDAPENAVLDGTYRTTVTEEMLIAGGAPGGDAAANAGIYTFTLDGGVWKMHSEGADGSWEYDGEGDYEIVGDQVTFRDPTYNLVDVLTWKRVPGRTLLMVASVESVPGQNVIWGDPAWQELPPE